MPEFQFIYVGDGPRSSSIVRNQRRVVSGTIPSTVQPGIFRDFWFEHHVDGWHVGVGRDETGYVLYLPADATVEQLAAELERVEIPECPLGIGYVIGNKLDVNGVEREEEEEEVQG